MQVVRGQPPESASFGPLAYTPAAVATWFGARFAALASPGFQTQYLAQSHAESSPAGSTTPVSLTMRHRLDGECTLDVTTRRRNDSRVTLPDHMWLSLVELWLATSGQNYPQPRRIAEAQAIVESRPPQRDSVLPVDRRTVPAIAMSHDGLAVIGGLVDGSFVSVVAPTGYLAEVHVELRPRGDDDTEALAPIVR